MLGSFLCLCFSLPGIALKANPPDAQPVFGPSYWFTTFPFLLLEEYHIHRGDVFGGKVVALAEDAITVKWWTGIPRTFEVAPTVASKRIPLEWHPGCGHRLGDVRLGDMVGIDLTPTPRGYVVIAMGIHRRPGGIIPPAEDDHLPEKYRMHNIFNAQQFVEEEVVPRLSRILRYLHPVESRMQRE